MDNEKKRVLLIANSDIESTESLGVAKKLKGEYKAFQKLGTDIYFLTFCHDTMVLLHDNETKVVCDNKGSSGYIQNIQFFNSAPQICKELKIDLCYIRFPLSDWAFMKMVRALQKICKVYIEIPTYPYDEENKKYKNPVSQFNFMQDKLFRKQWKKYVDRVVTFSDDKEIFDVPCININNGIDVESVKYIGDELNYDGDITLISVALMRLAHGYDRVIEGLREYYSSGNAGRIVRYNVVGNGEELPHLKELVEKYHLNEYVTFWGTQTGEKLDEIYRKSQIGLAMLGGHRVGCEKISDLKSREYCAKGIPFVSATIDNAFPANCPFIMKAPANEQPLNIQDVIRFYDSVKAHSEVHRDSRTFAETHIGWAKQLEKVIESVEI